MSTFPFDPSTLKDPIRFYEFLRGMNDRLAAVQEENAALKRAISSINSPQYVDELMRRASKALTGSGAHPLDVTGNHGQLAESQIAQLIILGADPTIAANNIDANLYDVGSFATYNGQFYFVNAGNPHTWVQVNLAGNFVTINTAQSVTGGKDFQTYTKITGTNTNDSAAAGYIGEVISLGATGVALTSGVNANILSVSLTPGDWDVFGNVLYSPAATTSVTNFTASINTTSATLGPAVTRMAYACPAFVPNAFMGWPVPFSRISLAALTTVYLVAQATFTVSTMTGAGSIFARRSR